LSGFAHYSLRHDSIHLKVIGIARGGPVNVDAAAARKKDTVVALWGETQIVADQTFGHPFLPG
jgi:phosphoglycerate dehydrogenase-like enzyme